MADKLRILAIGAHPDDCDLKAGGAAALWSAAGHVVRFVSATNGETGHHEQAGAALVRRRQAESAAAARTLGIEFEILPNPTGQLEPTLACRRMFIRLIRRFSPDLVLTHRPNDYHPDHRATAQLVMDSSYLVMVPNNAPEVPPLRHMPVIAYFSDTFQKPCPFQPAVVVDIDRAWPAKLDALHCYTSQMYEWLPWTLHKLEEVPADDAARKKWLEPWRGRHDIDVANRFRALLVARYGPQRGPAVRYAEAFEGSEYGAPLDEPAIERFFAGL